MTRPRTDYDAKEYLSRQMEALSANEFSGFAVDCPCNSSTPVVPKWQNQIFQPFWHPTKSEIVGYLKCTETIAGIK